jgi:hypothetical protein
MDDMAASIFIEQESGTWTGRINRHNGYYAGDFSARQTTGAPPARSRLVSGARPATRWHD